MTNETNKIDVAHFRALRKEAGLKIDPQTAEVDWTYAQTLAVRLLPR